LAELELRAGFAGFDLAARAALPFASRELLLVLSRREPLFEDEVFLEAALDLLADERCDFFAPTATSSSKAVAFLGTALVFTQQGDLLTEVASCCGAL
jgi:hypothetical protein